MDLLSYCILPLKSMIHNRGELYHKLVRLGPGPGIHSNWVEGLTRTRTSHIRLFPEPGPGPGKETGDHNQDQDKKWKLGLEPGPGLQRGRKNMDLYVYICKKWKYGHSVSINVWKNGQGSLLSYWKPTTGSLLEVSRAGKRAANVVKSPLGTIWQIKLPLRSHHKLKSPI